MFLQCECAWRVGRAADMILESCYLWQENLKGYRELQMLATWVLLELHDQ